MNTQKRIRDISSCYHCSIIGTCLTLSEARELLEKATDSDLSECSDYILHGLAVNKAGEMSRFSNRLNEKLNAKYRTDVYRCQKMKTVHSLEQYWIDSYAGGNIAGPYWAIFSHSESTSELLNRVFGDVHMLSHLTGSSERISRAELIRKDQQIAELESQIQAYKDKISESSFEKRELQKVNRNMLKQLNSIRRSTPAETSGCGYAIPAMENEKLKKKLSVLETRNESLGQRVFALMEELNCSREFNDVMSRFRISETPLFCGGGGGQELPVNLGDKKVLLVGGRSSMVPHCKAFVETMNGRFFHHDGGREQSRTVLQKLAKSADIVICALDCVSHDASRCVKRMCGEEQQVIMMKNSGLSTFAREIERAV